MAKKLSIKEQLRQKKEQGEKQAPIAKTPQKARKGAKGTKQTPDRQTDRLSKSPPGAEGDGDPLTELMVSLARADVKNLWDNANKWLYIIATIEMTSFATVAKAINDGKEVAETLAQQAALLCNIGASASKIIGLAKKLKFIDSVEAAILTDISDKIREKTLGDVLINISETKL